METTIGRRLGAEAVGTAILLATVVGSGIMADKLAGGNVAVALLGNTIPTGAILVVLILVFGPVSGAHFNPAVSLALALRGALPWRLLSVYVASQLVGAVVGVSGRAPDVRSAAVAGLSHDPLRPGAMAG